MYLNPTGGFAASKKDWNCDPPFVMYMPISCRKYHSGQIAPNLLEQGPQTSG
jgi:hypothetical protein